MSLFWLFSFTRPKTGRTACLHLSCVGTASLLFLAKTRLKDRVCTAWATILTTARPTLRFYPACSFPRHLRALPHCKERSVTVVRNKSPTCRWEFPNSRLERWTAACLTSNMAPPAKNGQTVAATNKMLQNPFLHGRDAQHQTKDNLIKTDLPYYKRLELQLDVSWRKESFALKSLSDHLWSNVKAFQVVFES